MTWEIVLGIIALAGFVGSVATWISKLSKTLGVLESTIKVLNETISEFKRSSHSTHEKIFERLTEDEKTLENHEGRILSLERRQ
ncbi:MAG: hypothetical protein IJD10_02500 [Clostridia bacterium]|nr:hypothetical protein [Clostridia bacterium]